MIVKTSIRRAADLRAARDRRGQLVLRAGGEGREEQEQPTCHRCLCPDHAPSISLL